MKSKLLRKAKWGLPLFILLLVALLFLLFFWYQGNRFSWVTKERKVRVITVMTDLSMAESGSLMRQGMDQAALELNIDLQFSNLNGNQGAGAQEEVLRREWTDSPAAIIVTPPSESLLELSRKTAEKIPIILMGEGFEAKSNLPLVACDYEAEGRELAARVLAKEQVETVLFIYSKAHQYSGKLMLKALEEALPDEIAVRSECIEESETPRLNEGRIFLRALGQTRSVVIAADTRTAETLGYARKDLVASDLPVPTLYARGSGLIVAELLEGRNLDGVLVEKSYNLGYLAVQKAALAADRHRSKSDPVTVGSLWVTPEEIFDREIQILLFPKIR